MGWWKVQGGAAIVGDEPLDALGGAVANIVRQYQAAFGRRPTVAEWEILLRMTLGLEQAEYKCTDDGVPTEVRITARP